MARSFSVTCVDVLHAVVDEVRLPFAVQLAVDGMADQLPVEADDARLDGKAVRRRRLKIADVADAEQRQVQCPRNRRGGHREHIDLLRAAA